MRYYSCTAFEGIPCLRHGFSTREGGSGVDERSLNLNYSPRDSVERVRGNRQRFLAALHLENARLATLRQVHSNRVYIIEDNACEWNESEGDALATAAEGIALAVKTADCFPVLIADRAKRAIAAVHSGWRGTLSRILFLTIQEMRIHFGSSPSDLIVAVGPGIRSCCFEVGSDVAGLFEREYPDAHASIPIPDRTGKHFLDLCRALDMQLDLAAIPQENRYDLGECTRCNNNRFFSYRAEGPASGRMMAVIGLKGKAGDPSIVDH